jgi:hypothetical protein
MKKRGLLAVVLIIPLCLIGCCLAMQIVPFGRSHVNPPVTQEPKWDSPRTRELAKRACFDCHSNETVWPWYSNVAPVSWLVQNDVDEGRSRLNFSEWNGGGREIERIGGAVLEGEMPPSIYLVQHPDARLSDPELQELANGLQNTVSGGQ